MKHVSADAARAWIAACVLGDTACARRLGEVTLHPHQVIGAQRVGRLLDRHGGALLADAVGLGKTYVALACARDTQPLVIGPAAVRDVWERASAATGVALRFLSFEGLSRREPPPITPAMVIVDEAHQLRTRGTRRFRRAEALCAGARTLLLSATPVQNRVDDLRTILSLFLGQRAFALAEERLADYIVRRTERDVEPGTVVLPSLSANWLEIADDTDCLDRLLALPPPLPPRDGEDGGVLLSYTLVRQWASSRGALQGALRRRLARAHAMADTLAAGRLPSTSELAAWCVADGTQQLAFPELLSEPVAEPDALLAQVRRHAAAVRQLTEWLGQSPDPDVQRSAALRGGLETHRGERVVAFSEHGDTVTTLFRHLMRTVRVAALTSRGGRIASGPISRRELLASFAPGAGARAGRHDLIDLLLSTDVLSEGVSLHDASVVIHLDLTWNPARLEQRVGRVRRLGATHDHVTVYAVRPPAPTERLLDIERRLERKLRAAARAVGLAGTILPGLGAPRDEAPAPERVNAILRKWARDDHPGVPVVAAVRAPCRAAIACVRRGHETTLLALEGERVAEGPGVCALLERANGPDAAVRDERVHASRATIERWLRDHQIAGVVDLTALHVARSRRTMLRRVDGIARRTPHHGRAAVAPLLRAARSAATATLTAGAEQVLHQLALAPLRDEAWLRAVGEFAAIHARQRTDEPTIVALLLLEPD